MQIRALALDVAILHVPAVDDPWQRLRRGRPRCRRRARPRGPTRLRLSRADGSGRSAPGRALAPLGRRARIRARRGLADRMPPALRRRSSPPSRDGRPRARKPASSCWRRRPDDSSSRRSADRGARARDRGVRHHRLRGDLAGDRRGRARRARAGRRDLALATGFTALDAEPIPSVTLGEAGLSQHRRGASRRSVRHFARWPAGASASPWRPPSSTRPGERTSPAPARPAGPRSPCPAPAASPTTRDPSRVWYLLPGHGPRQLVERVDVVCGAVPPAGAIRRLLTPAGCFELDPGGWRALWLTPDGEALVAGAPGLGIETTGSEPVVTEPDAQALAALERVDPHGSG